jgi:hypothetical protein
MKVGTINENLFSGHGNLTKGSKKKYDDLHLAELMDALLIHRVPANVETAAFVPAANDVWEDFDLITALNAVLTTDIRTGEAVRLVGTLELVNAEAAVNNVKYASGGVPDNDDTVRASAMTGSIGSDYLQGIELITDVDGQIKIETDDVTNVTFVFHLESFQYVKTAAQS